MLKNVYYDIDKPHKDDPDCLITLKRIKKSNIDTIGKLYINGDFFCYTLEDAIRDKKIKGKTAIPAGLYFVKLTRSNRFKRIMPQIYNVPNDLSVERNGMRFTGVRMHGGNTHHDTEGCPLVAYNLINDHTIQGTAEKDLTKALESYSIIMLKITD